MQQRSLLSGGPLRHLWSSYEAQLQKNPVATQVTTSFIMWGIGDVLAQRIERFERERDAAATMAAAAATASAARDAAARQAAADQPLGSEVAAVGAEGKDKLDWHRIFLTALFGAVLVGPVGHYWWVLCCIAACPWGQWWWYKKMSHRRERRGST